MLQILSSLDTHITHLQGSHAWKSESVHGFISTRSRTFLSSKKKYGNKNLRSNLRFWMRAGAFGK